MSYTIAQLRQLWIDNGGSAASAPVAAAVAYAESSGDPASQNHNTNGTTDRGLWQINSIHGAQSTFDVTANTRAAIAISNNGTNWFPWTTFNSGAYKKYLIAYKAIPTNTPYSQSGLPGSGNVDAGGVAGGLGGLTGVGGVQSDLQAATDMTGVIKAIWNTLASGATWERILAVVAGTVLIFMALKGLSGVSGPSVASVAKVVA
jgi:hypothetical protein